MGRSGYTYDCENMNLWRGTVKRAICGKRGQEFFQELAAAMDVMPEKLPIAEKLIQEDTGDVCAIGVVCKARGIDVSHIDYTCPKSVGKAVGISMAMAAEIEYMNDEWENDKTPEARWTRMREWVEAQIIK